MKSNSYTTYCPICNNPIKVITVLERQSIPPYWIGDQEFVDEVIVPSICNLHLTGEEIDDLIDIALDENQTMSNPFDQLPNENRYEYIENIYRTHQDKLSSY